MNDEIKRRIRNTQSQMERILNGQEIGDNYIVERRLGQSFIGRGTFLARHKSIGRVVLKLYPGRPDLDEDLAQQYRREIDILVKLSLKKPHHNIVRVLARGVHNPGGKEQDFLVMEYVEGHTLEEKMKTGKAPLKYALQLASAVSYAHENGVTHRNLNPSSILFAPKRGIVLTGFGSAKAEGNISAQVSAALDGAATEDFYIPPELLDESIREGEALTQTGDQYSLGLILYEMLTGTKPFEGEEAMIFNAMKLTQKPKPVENNPALNSVLMRALQKKPSDRYDAVRDLYSELSLLG